MSRYIDVDALIAWITTHAQDDVAALVDVLAYGVSAGKSVVFSAPFTDTSNWTSGRTSAYPGSPPQTNRNDNKLDRLDTSRKAPQNGRFAAHRRSDGLWDCDLVPTEFGRNGFQVRTGDELTALVTVNNVVGAWPAIWTWKDGGNEVDCFEYHPDNPNLLEFTNHLPATTTAPAFSYTDRIITPGAPFRLTTKFKAAGVEWWVNGTKVFTGTGLPATWSAYIIVNMSVSAGKYHPAPTGSLPLYADVLSLRVWR